MNQSKRKEKLYVIIKNFVFIIRMKVQSDVHTFILLVHLKMKQSEQKP
jgi:hypothetical protein